MPELHIITGSNGAGKSSVGPAHLPTHIKDTCTVFDGDKLALNKKKELLATKQYSPKEAQSMANDWIGPEFNEQVKTALKSSLDFVYEGHFREDSSWQVINTFKKKGYTVHMVFFGLVNIERSRMRVFERAVSGGHNVSLAEIELNYEGNLIQLDKRFKVLDELKIIDSSETAPKLLLHIVNGKVIYHPQFIDQPEWFTEYLINISRMVYPEILVKQK